MAKDTETSARNKAFLRQLEIQRLNKPCNRIIDLRGKVAGECQAYTFGERVHYLDDRAYLLTKQLLAHFNGRYTMGVYESLFKALKMLTQQQSITLDTEKEIFHHNPNQLQYISFDQILQPKEPRITYASPIDIIITDILYHGSTVDISSSTIRITLRRAHIIKQGSNVSVTFSGLNGSEQANPTSLLTRISYNVVHIEHDEKYTYAMLVRNRDDNIDITHWFDDWIQKHNDPAQTDLEASISNLLSHYYLRLLVRSLNTPLLWLSYSDDSEPIKACHLIHNDDEPFEFFNNETNKVDLSLLPINKVMESGEDYLLVISKINNNLKSIAVPRSNPNLVAKALNWYRQQQHCHVFLLQAADQQFDHTTFDDEIAYISTIDPSYGSILSSRLSSITHTISIIDLSSVCLNITSQAIFDENELNLFSIINIVQDQLPISGSFKLHIQRSQQRFFVSTPVNVHVGTKVFNVLTLDFSRDGLSLLIPDTIDIPKNSRITLDFTRWQNQTDKHDLTDIPYLVKNKTSVAKGQSRLGLQRLSHLSTVDINQFFEWVIEHNKDKLAINNHDLIANKEASIYRRLLPATISSIPLYFGVDSSQKRILQAIAATPFNHAVQYDSLWRALTKRVRILSEILINQTSSNNLGVVFGLFCYQNKSKNDDWVINTDFDFSYPAGKDLFLNRAMAHELYVFFQCSLIPIQLNALDNEDDLKIQLLALRNQTPHKVKQIRDLLYSLFSIANLVDVTDIVEAAYTKD